MNSLQAAVAIMAAALAFRQKYEKDLAEDQRDRALLPKDTAEATKDVALSEEMAEEDWWNFFRDEVQDKGLSHYLKDADRNFEYVAGLAEGEPAFTFLGRDKAASVVLHNYYEMLIAFAPEIRSKKMEQINDAIEEFEGYTPQRVPD